MLQATQNIYDCREKKGKLSQLMIIVFCRWFGSEKSSPFLTPDDFIDLVYKRVT